MKTSIVELGARYEDLGLLGRGGMGDVRRVRDRKLGRRLAIKILKPERNQHSYYLARFLSEAQVGSQLQHPGIVPVYDVGQLPNGAVYFTMREIQGRELGKLIREVHQASQGNVWKVSPSGWTFRRLISALAWVCEAVGYAHRRGVVHRDIKPANIMVGREDEVLVVDWGLAKVLGRPESPPDAETVETSRHQSGQHATRMGAVAGTVAYMPLEQAKGRIDQIDARTDVYALGAVLYEILSRRPPYPGRSANVVLGQIIAGPPEPVREASAWSLPEGLVEITHLNPIVPFGVRFLPAFSPKPGRIPESQAPQNLVF